MIFRWRGLVAVLDEADKVMLAGLDMRNTEKNQDRAFEVSDYLEEKYGGAVTISTLYYVVEDLK